MSTALPAYDGIIAQQIVFVLDDVSDWQTLTAGVPANTEFHLLSSRGDALAQMTAILGGRSELSAVHLVSHGSAGSLSLGSTKLDSTTLPAHAGKLAAIGAALRADGDLLLYGCDVAAGESGALFIQALAQATGADVAASTDPTGATTKGGDWVLEASSGLVETASTFDSAALQAYEGLLGTATFSGTVSSQNGFEDTAFLFNGVIGTGGVTLSTSGNWQAIVSVTSGNGKLSDGSTDGTSLAGTGDQAGINAFLASLRFVPDANWNGTATVSVEVQSYSNSSDKTTTSFDIAFAPVPDRPVTGTLTALAAVDEDTAAPGGATVSSVVTGFTDADGNTLVGVAITDNAASSSQGDWQYSTDGSNWYAVGSVSASTALVLDTSAKLRFLPKANWFGTPGSLTLNAIDSSGSRSYTSGLTRATTDATSAGDISASGSAFTTSVNPVNDAPTTTAQSASVAKNSSVSTVTLSSSDIDSGTNTTTDAVVSKYKIVDVSGLNGTLSKAGLGAITAGTELTLSQATNLTYTPTANFAGSASFTFQAIDAGGLASNTSTFTITVSQVNMAPVVTVPSAQSGTEDTALTVSGVSLADSDDAGATVEQLTLSANNGNIGLASTTGLTVTAGALGSHSVTLQGTLADLNAALAGSNLSYTPDATYNGSDTITVVLSDLGSGLTGTSPATHSQTIALTIAPVVDKPVTGSATLAAVLEDAADPPGASVASLLANYTDADGDALSGIAISANASTAAQGAWQYSTDYGANWTDVGAVSATSALLLSKTALLRFAPTANWNGTPGDLTVHAIDASGTPKTWSATSSTQYAASLSASDIDPTGAALSTSVTSVPDPFTVVADTFATVDEGGLGVIGRDSLELTNVEATASQIVYTVGADSSLGEGELRLYSNATSFTVLGTGSTFTQADINAGSLKYLHNGNEPLTTQQIAYTAVEGPVGFQTSKTGTLQIKVSPVNDAPVMTVTGGAVDVLRGSSLNFGSSNISVTDPDNTDLQLMFKITTGTAHGDLTLDGRLVDLGSVFSYADLKAGKLAYKHDNSYNLSDSFKVELRDGAGAVLPDQPIALNITLANYAPTGLGTLTGTIWEDPTSYGALANNNGKKLSEYTGFSFSDTDPSGAEKGQYAGAAVVGNAATSAQGVWQYSTNGSNWAAVGSVNDSGRALVLSADTYVRFVPKANWNGTPGALTLRALDGSYTGSYSVSNGTVTPVYLDTTTKGLDTPISANTNTLTLTVDPVNDDPTLVYTHALPLSGNGTSGTFGSWQLSSTDIDSATITYQLTALPTQGELKLSGSTLSLGQTFTQADISSGNLVYSNNSGSTASSDSFSVTATDGGTNAVTGRAGGIYADATTLQTITVPITIAQYSPGVAGVWGTGTDYLSTLSNTAVSTSTDTLLATDSGTSKAFSSPTNGSNGTVSLSGSTVTYTPNSKFFGWDYFTYTMTATEGSATGGVWVNVINQAPVLNPGTQVQNEGSVATLTTSQLGATDAEENDSSLVYTLTSLAALSNGTLYYDSGTATATTLSGSARALIEGDSFTQADITAGRIKFQHDGSEDFLSSFDFQLSDGYNSPLAKTLSIDVTPVNDQPSITTVAAKVYEGGHVIVDASKVIAADVDGIGSDKAITPDTLSYTVSAPSHGSFRLVKAGSTYDGSNASTYDAVTPGSTVITQAQLTGGKLIYVNDGNEYLSDTVTFTVSDNSGAGNQTNSAALTIKIIAVNDDPVVAVNTGLRTADGKAVYEGSSRVLSVADLLGTDTDNAENQLQFRITNKADFGEIILTTLDGSGAAVEQTLGVDSKFTVEDVRNGKVKYVHDASQSTQDSFQFTLSDSGGGVEPAGTFIIDITAVNYKPGIKLPEAKIASEDAPRAITGISVSDPESLDAYGVLNNSFGPITVTLAAGHGKATLTASGAAVVTNNGSASVTVSGTLGDVNATLSSLVYLGDANYNGSDQITVTVNDGGNSGLDPDAVTAIGNALPDQKDLNTSSQSTSSTLAITVKPFNDAPTISGLSSAGYTEGGSAVTLDGDVALGDIDLAALNNWGGASLTLSRLGGASAEDSFSASGTSGSGLYLDAGSVLKLNGTTIGSYTTGSGSLTLTFADGVTTAQVQAAAQGIAYSNSRVSLGAGATADVTLNWTLSDGDIDPDRANNPQGAGGQLSASSTQTVTLTGINSAPTATAGTLASVNEDAGAANPPNSASHTAPAGSTVSSLFGSLFSDPDLSGSGSTLAGLRITANAATAAQGEWQYSTNAGSSWTSVSSSGSLSIDLVASDLIRFLPSAANYNGTVGSLSVKLSDGTALSNEVTLSTSVLAVNEAPTVSLTSSSYSATEAIAVNLGTAGYALADIEATRGEGPAGSLGQVSMTISNARGKLLVGTTGSWTVSGNDSGSVTIRGSLDAVTSALQTLTYTTGNNPTTSETISFVLSDLGNNGTSTTMALTATTQISVAVTQVNDKPTASGPATLGAVAEDTNAASIPGATVDSLFSALFSDVDTLGPNHSFSGIAIVGNAANPATEGVWQYSTDAGTSWTDIASSGLSDSNAIVLGHTANDLIRFVPNVLHYNGTPGSLSVRLSDGTALSLGTGKTLATGSSDGWSLPIALNTSVSKVNDAPKIANLHNNNVEFVEAVGVKTPNIAILLDAGVDSTLTDVELTSIPAETNFAGATLTVRNQGSVDTDDLYLVQNLVNNITTSGAFTNLGNGIFQYENGAKISHNDGTKSTWVATITDNGATSGQLVLTFTAGAYQAAVEAILHNLSYSSKNDAIASSEKKIDITFSDGNTGLQGTGGALSNTATVYIKMTPTNDAPTLSTGDISLTATEDVTASGSVTTSPATPATLLSLLGAKFSDPDGVAGSAFTGSSLAGVAVSAYSDGTAGQWEIKLSGGSWVTLSSVATEVASDTGAAISAANALLLAASTEIRYVPIANANTQDATAPSLTVFAVESAIPEGAPTTNAGAITFTTDLNSPLTYNTTTDTLESRVSATSVNVNVTIAAVNDAPVIDGSGLNLTPTENALTGSTLSVEPIKLLTVSAVSDIDLGTTDNLTSDVFGAGTITATLTDGVAGDILQVDPTVLAGLTAAVSTSGGTGSTPLVITLAAGNGTAPGTTVADVVALHNALQYQNNSDNPTANGTDNVRSYTVVLNDGKNAQSGGDAGGSALSSNTLSGTITITQVNDAPVVDLNSGVDGFANSVTWTEGANTTHTAIAIAPSATLVDVDNQNLTEMKLVLSGVLNGDSEILTIGGQQFQLGTGRSNVAVGSHLVSYDKATTTFTIVPDGSTIGVLTDYQSLLRGISYSHSSDNPSDGNRTISVTVTDAGASDDLPLSSQQTSAIAVATINVDPANDQPRLSGLDAASYLENVLQGAAAWIDQDITLVDADSANLDGGQITISGLTSGDIVSLPGSVTGAAGLVQLSGSDVQHHDGSNWVTVGTASGGSGTDFVISLNASATPAIAERILEQLTFRNNSDAPGATRTLSYSVSDGDSGGTVASATLTVTIIRDNDAPTLSATSTTPTYAERASSAVALLSGTVSFADPDLPANFFDSNSKRGSITVALDGYVSGDTLSVLHQGTASSQIGVSGSTISYNAGSGSQAFATTSGGNGTDLTITFTSNYATADAVQALLKALAYSNTSNDNPTVYGTDPTRAFTVTFNDGSNWFDATATETSAKTASLTGTLTLTPTADAPVITATANSYTENAAALTLASTLTLSDSDDTQASGATVQISANLSSANDSLSVSGVAVGSQIGGTNITVASYDASTGTLTLSGTDTLANYQAALRLVQFSSSHQDPAGNSLSGSRTITWSVTDANSNAIGAATGTQTTTLTLNPVNDAPTLSALDATSGALFVQAGAAVVIDPNVTLSDLELDSRDNWNGAQLTVARSGGANASDIFGYSGTLVSGLYLDGGVLKANGTAIGSYTNSAGTLVMTFNASATAALVDLAIQGITYSNAVTTPGALGVNSVTLSYTVNDQNSDTTGGGTAGSGQLQGSGGSASANGTIVVNIDRLPIAQADTASATEGLLSSSSTSATGDVTPALSAGGDVADTDQDSDPLTVVGIAAGSASGPLGSNVGSSVSGNYGSVTIAADGSYTYSVDNGNGSVQALAVGQTLTDTFSYTISDGRGGTSTTTLTVTINGSNDAPVLADTALTLTQTEDDPSPTGAVGTLVSTLVGGISDLDTSNPRGVAITAADTTQGSWYYSINGGTSWTAFTASTASALLLSSTARVYFKPNADWNGSVANALTLHAWDQSSGSNGGTADLTTSGSKGDGTAFSTASDTVSLSVTAVNDRPVSSGNATLGAFSEDVLTPSGVTLSSLASSFGYSDATDNQSASSGNDNSSAMGYLAITGSSGYSSSQGSWQVSKTASPNAATASDWITIPDSGLTATAALVFAADRQIRFVAAADFHGTPGSLTVQLADSSATLTTSSSASNTLSLASNGGTGTTGSWDSSSRTLGTTVSNVNDAPTLSGSTTLTATNEDNTSSSRTAASIAASLTYGDATDNQTAVSGGANAASSLSAIAIVKNDAGATQGKWQYTLDGLTWQDVSPSVGDSTAVVLQVGNTDHQVRFLPAANFNGTPGALSWRGADSTWSSTGRDATTGIQDISGANATTGPWSSSIASATLGITVNPVNDAPTLSGLDATSPNATTTAPHVQGGAAVVIDSNVTLADIDLDARNDWDGAQLTVARSGGASADDVFGASGSLTLAAGGVLQVSGTAIGSYTNSAGTLVMTFNASATAALVDLAIQGITYSNAVTTPGALGYNSVTLSYTVNDQNSDTTGGGSAGSGQAQGAGGRANASASIIVHIDRLPIAQADTASVAEGLLTTSTTTVSGDVTPSSTLGGNVSDTDQDNDSLTVVGVAAGSASGPLSGSVATSVSGSYGSVTVAADGSYTYTVDNTRTAVQVLAVGETLSDTFSYTISDGRGGSSTTTLTVTINGSNDAPVLADTALTLTQTEDDPTPTGAVGTLVSTLVGGITDLDTSNPRGVAITAADTTQGSWYYSINNGTSWTAFTASTASALLLADTARVYFKPNADWNGSVASALTLHAWDQSSGSNGGTADLSVAGSTGDATAFSTASDTVSLTVTPVNDAPVLDQAPAPKLNGIIENVLDADNLGTLVSDLVVNGSVTDIDLATPSSAPEAIYVSAVDEAHGHWQYQLSGSSSWVTISFAGVNAGKGLLLDSSDKLRFVPEADWNGKAYLTFGAWDKTNASPSGSYVSLASIGGITPYSGMTDTASILVITLLDLDTTNSGSFDNADTFREVEDVDDRSHAVSFSRGTSISNITNLSEGTLTRLQLSIDTTTLETGDQVLVGDTAIDITGNTATGSVSFNGTTFRYSISDDGTTRTLTFLSRNSDNTADAAAFKPSYEALLDALKYNSTSNNFTDGSTRVFSVWVFDGPASGVGTFTVTLDTINDLPNIDANGGLAGSGNTVVFKPRGPEVLIAPDLVLTELEGQDLTSVTLHLGTGVRDNQFGTRYETLSLTPAGAAAAAAAGVTVTATPGDFSYTLKLSSATALAPSVYQALLREVVYEDANPNAFSNDRTVTLTATDTTNQVGFTTSAANASIAVGQKIYVGGIDSGRTVAEVLDSQHFVASGPIDGLEAGLTLAFYNGATQVTSASALSTPAATITVQVPWTPVIDLDGTATAAVADRDYATTYVEQAPAVAIATHDASVTDQGGLIRSLTVTLTNPLDNLAGGPVYEFLTQPSAEILAWLASRGITASGDGTTQIVFTASGAGSDATNFQVGLRGVGYRNLDDAPDNSAARVVHVSATDVDGNVGVDADTIINLTPVNDAPNGVDSSVSLAEDGSYSFALSDFGYSDASDGGANALIAVRVSTLPALGSLKLGGASVSAGQTVSVADIAAGLLSYSPAANANGTAYSSFTFQVQDNGGTANGGVALDPTPATMTIHVVPLNDAPVLSNAVKSATTISEDATGNAGQTVASLLGTVSDVDSTTQGGVHSASNGTLSGMAVYQASNGGAIGGQWEYRLKTGVDGSGNPVYGSWAAIAPASGQALLLRSDDAVRFVPDGLHGTTAGNLTKPSLQYYAWDQSAGSAGSQVASATRGGSTALSTASGSVDIAITDANDAPVADLNGASAGVDDGVGVDFNPRGQAVAVFTSGVALGDPDYGDLLKKVVVTLQPSGLLDNAFGTTHERLSLTPGSLPLGLAVSGNGSGTDGLTLATQLTFTSTLGSSGADFQTALAKILYYNGNPNAYAGPRSVAVQLWDTSDTASTPATRAVNVVWGPVLDNNGASAAGRDLTVSYMQGDPAVPGSNQAVAVMASDAELFDQDGNVRSATLKLLARPDGTDEYLTISDLTALTAAGITVSGNGTDTIVFTAANLAPGYTGPDAGKGLDSTAFQLAVRTVKYIDNATNPDLTQRQVLVSAIDMDGHPGVPATTYINVSEYNHAPDLRVATGNSATASLTETDAKLIATGTLTVDDADSAQTVTPSVLSVTATLGSGKATLADLPSNAVLKAMLGVSGGKAAGVTTGTVSWSFDSGSTAFNPLAPGQTLTLTYTVRATDSHVTGGHDDQTVTVTITGSDDKPTAVALTNQVATLPESTSTASRVKVADIVVTDDSAGPYTYTLTGADAARFEVDGGVLYLKAGVTLDFETKPSYAVTVGVVDTNLGGTPVTAGYTLALSNSNDAPTGLTLLNKKIKIAENASTTSRTKVADVQVVDDGLSSHQLSLSGNDADEFELDGTVLYLKAGVTLDFETQDSYDVTVSAIDPSLAGSSPVSASHTLAVTDVNEAPTDVELDIVTDSLPENTPTTSRIKLADIDVIDDAVGNKSVAISGPDSPYFEVETGVLYLRANVQLNYEDKDQYQITVKAYDLSVSGSTPVTTSYTLNVIDVIEYNTIEGTSANNTIIGTANDDAIYGYGGNDSIKGNGGNDTLDGGTGDDTLVGGPGDDTFILDSPKDVVISGGGNDTVMYGLFGSGFIVYNALTYTMGSGIANLILTGLRDLNGIGNAANNQITGNAGNNRLDGKAGADILTGAKGNDVYVIDNSGDSVVELADGGTDLVEVAIASAGGSYTLAGQVEHAKLTSTVAFNLIGNALDNQLTGNTAANTLDGDAGVDTLTGGAGNDRYLVDLLASGALQDKIVEANKGGTDTLVLRGSSTNTSAYTHTLATEIEHLDASATGSSLLNLTGNAANNQLTGNSAANLLDGGKGADTMAGGDGDDTYVVDNAKDVVSEVGGGGSDTIRSSVTYTLNTADAAGVEHLILTGSSALNGTGNALDNSLLGNTGVNSLDGGAGNDTLTGGKGADLLKGGSGRDTFVFAAGDSGQASGFDKISDYAKGAAGVGDLIDYSALMTIGGSNDTATSSQAAINPTTGVASFATGSGATLGDALSDIATRFNSAGDAAGEYALFRVKNTGDFYLFVSDGAKGVTSNDLVVQLVGIKTVGGIDLTGGDLTITS